MGVIVNSVRKIQDIHQIHQDLEHVEEMNGGGLCNALHD